MSRSSASPTTNGASRSRRWSSPATTSTPHRHWPTSSSRSAAIVSRATSAPVRSTSSVRCLAPTPASSTSAESATATGPKPAAASETRFPLLAPTAPGRSPLSVQRWPVAVRQHAGRGTEQLVLARHALPEVAQVVVVGDGAVRHGSRDLRAALLDRIGTAAEEALDVIELALLEERAVPLHLREVLQDARAAFGPLQRQRVGHSRGNDA